MIEYEIFIILVIELDKIIILSLANVNCISLMSIFKQKIDEVKESLDEYNSKISKFDFFNEDYRNFVKNREEKEKFEEFKIKSNLNCISFKTCLKKIFKIEISTNYKRNKKYLIKKLII